MAVGHLPDDPGITLREEIRKMLPNGADWLETPHELLGGETPEQRILKGDFQSVKNLLDSILFIGVI
jgi:hypothetical protein